MKIEGNSGDEDEFNENVPVSVIAALPSASFRSEATAANKNDKDRGRDCQPGCRQCVYPGAGTDKQQTIRASFCTSEAISMKEALAIQSKDGITPQSQRTTLKNYSALLKYLGRNDEAKQIDEQMKTVK